MNDAQRYGDQHRAEDDKLHAGQDGHELLRRTDVYRSRSQRDRRAYQTALHEAESVVDQPMRLREVVG